MATSADRETARLWRVSRTVHEMVRDRGYLVADYEVEMTLDDFKASNGTDRGQLSFQCDHASNANDRIYVFFSSDATVSKANVKQFIGAMETHDAKRGILIYAEKVSSIANKTIVEMQSSYQLETFSEAELLVNITRHFLVPKHEIMTPAEKRELISKYRLKDTQLPRIMMSDPVARYYGMKRGQVMRIERASETAGRYITYRICM